MLYDLTLAEKVQRRKKIKPLSNKKKTYEMNKNHFK